MMRGRWGMPRLKPRATGNASLRTSDDEEGLALDLGQRERPRPGPRTTQIASPRTSDDGGGLAPDLVETKLESSNDIW